MAFGNSTCTNKGNMQLTSTGGEVADYFMSLEANLANHDGEYVVAFFKANGLLGKKYHNAPVVIVVTDAHSDFPADPSAGCALGPEYTGGRIEVQVSGSGTGLVQVSASFGPVDTLTWSGDGRGICKRPIT